MGPAPIPYGRHEVTDGDMQAVLSALQSGSLTQGPRVAEFEEAIASACGARYAVAVSSGTAGLHLAMLAAGLGPGDSVLVPANTFVASANCALYAGAEVRVVDIEPETHNLSITHLERTLANRSGPERPRVVVPVHFAGHPVNLPALATVAHRHGLLMIEDACHALGAAIRAGGDWFQIGCGRWSIATVLSLHPVKHITAGEGGVVLTNDGSLAARVRTLRHHGIVRDPEHFERVEGRDEPWYYEMQMLGFNYRLTDLQCALGLSQLRRLAGYVGRRREIAARYEAALAGLAHVRLPTEAPWARHAYHLFVLEVDFDALGISRVEVMRRLRAQGVGSAVHYIPLYRQPYYRKRYGLDPAQFPVTEAYYERALTIPLFPSMTDAQVDYVASAVRRVLGQSI